MYQPPKTPLVNKDEKNLLSNIKYFALDMDGTIYLGEKWIDGAKEFLHRVQESGRKFCFMTNNSSKSASDYVEKQQKMALDISQEQIVPSGQATIAYLEREYANKRVYLLGNPLLGKEFMHRGIKIVGSNPDVVVSAFDTSFDYDKMRKFCDFVRDGVPYIATHPDYNCPTETGYMPDIGCIHSFVHASTGRMPDNIIGKPNSEIISYTLARMGAKKSNTAVVGDRLYTDVKAGVQNGLLGIFVLSGEAQLKDIPTAGVIPNLVFDSLKEITPLL